MSGRIEEENRPDPDALLNRVQAEERAQSRGHLKIFFGASAGVGKTYGMLQAAREKKAEGIDVVIGVVETHKRKETEALVQGLEILPPKFVEYKNTKLREFDLEGAIKRKPTLILIDELAHTNAPGTKNAKRWQDVQDILTAGIDVYATLNVQHVESLNDVVAQITGVIVRETIPDSVIEQADEIELMDLPPDDLLKRLKEGKVYLGEQAERAAVNFFRKGNLTALRELALRATADRVNQQVQSYRESQSIAGTWATTERILVCVGPSPFSARLVRAGRRMAAGLRADWFAVYVEPPAIATLPEKARQQVQKNLSLAEQLGAETVILNGQDVVSLIINFARDNNITKIITGKPVAPSWRDRLFGSFVDELIRRSGDIDIYVIKGDPEEESAPREYVSAERRLDYKSYVYAALDVIFCTIVASFMFGHFELSNIVMIYLLGVVFVAARYGRGPAVCSSIASVLAFDFFFVPPYHSFAVYDSQYLITFIVMLCVALVISSLTAKIQGQVESASLRERRTAALYSMSRELASARGLDTLIQIAVRHVAGVFDSEVIGLVPDPEGRLIVKAGNETTFPWTARERGVAQWVYDLGHPAGMGTDTLPGAEALYIPLNSLHGPVGVIGLHPKHAGRTLTTEQRHLLEAFANQAALAIDGDRLAEEAKNAQLQVETEKSRSALLSSVSHDLRTPLAAIRGAAGSLLEESTLDNQSRRELLQTISDESERLSRLVGNLLEMTKLDSGAKAKKEWCPLEEVVGSALTRLEKTLGGRPVTIKLPSDLPLIPIDVVMIEQVLINLLENAAKYTPHGSPIEISALTGDRTVTINIADNGPGLASGDEKKIFDKFYRGKTAGSTSGAGLGLPICRAIVEAHGGRIWAENRPSGGAIFHFTLPTVGERPPAPAPVPESRTATPKESASNA